METTLIAAGVAVFAILALEAILTISEAILEHFTQTIKAKKGKTK